MGIDTEEITVLLSEHHAIDVSKFDDSFLRKTIERRTTDRGILLFQDYLSYLKQNRSEAESIRQSLYVTYSEFFRNSISYIYMENSVLPLLFEKKKREKKHEIRIWSGACASGEEAYSTAILLDELLENQHPGITYRIFATDICETELSKARTGIFKPTSVNKVTLKRIQTYFEYQNDKYVINRRLMENIDFSRFDLFDDNYTSPSASIYGDFDLIFCCNLLFYYKPDYQKYILNKMANDLAIGGYLIAGETEREILKKNGFGEVFPNSSIYAIRNQTTL